MRAGSGQCGHSGAARRFIDHFNATSSWVTHSVLVRPSPEERAAAISLFIRVAGHLSDLGNFSGMFAVVSALAQGCVARLEVTWDSVAKSERNSLHKLQVGVFLLNFSFCVIPCWCAQRLMSGEKNYQRYRDEVGCLAQLIATRDGLDGAGTGTGVGE